MLQFYSTVYENTLKQFNSTTYVTKTYHEGKPLPFGTFVLKRSFTHVHFSDKLKPIRVGPYKIHTYELLSQNGSIIHAHRNHLVPSYLKNHFCTHIYVISCVSQTQPNLSFQNQFNMQIVTLPISIPINPSPTKTHHNNLLHHPLIPLTILHLPPMTTHLSNCMTTHLSKR